MTYQELFEKLQKKYAEKADIFMKMDKEISQVSGFGDIGDLANYNTAKTEWQLAHNDYWNFLSNTKGRDINPNDEAQIF